MKTNNDTLVNYDEKLIDDHLKSIFILSILFSCVIIGVLSIFVVLSLIKVQIVIGYLLGSICGNVLFFLKIKTIKRTNTLDLKKSVRKMSVLHLCIYALVLLAIYFVTRDIPSFVVTIAGILTNKIAIIIKSIQFKKEV